MRTVEEVLKDLRALSDRARAGENVSADRVRLEVEAAEHGIHVRNAPPAQRSRHLGPNADVEAIAKALAERGVTSEQVRALRTVDPAGKSSLTLAGTMTKALAEATPSAGGVLVPAEVSNELVTLIRARVAVMRLGPTIVHVEKELDLPYVSTGSAAYYVAENARIPVSEPTFALVPKLKPIELAALVPVSNRLLRDAQTNPTLEEALRGDMADALSGRQDLAFLQGVGGGTEPLGIRNHTGLTDAPDLGPDGGQPTLAQLKRFVHNVRARNAPFTRPGWIFAPAFLAYLDTLTDADGRPLLDSGLLSYDATGGGGRLLGYPFVTTSRIPTTLEVGDSDDCTYVVFGSDWQEAWVGQNLDLTLEASTTATYSPDGGTTHISAYQSRQTVFRALSAHDFALRRPEYFSVWEGVKVG
jgi:HK97 family phage major capsid protein